MSKSKVQRTNIHHINVRNRRITPAYLKFRTVRISYILLHMLFLILSLVYLVLRIIQEKPVGFYPIIPTILLCQTIFVIVEANKRIKVIRTNRFVLLPAYIANCSEIEYRGTIETGNSYSVDVAFRYTYHGQQRTAKFYLDDLTEKTLKSAKQFHLAFELKNNKLASTPFLVLRGKDYQIESQVGSHR